MKAEADLEETLKQSFALADAGRCPETRQLARYASGAMEPAEQQGFDAHLAGCPECRADLAGLEQAERMLRAEPEVRSLLVRIRAWIAQRPWAVAAPVLAAAMLFLVLHPQGPPASTLRPKGGGWQLFVGVDRDGKEFRTRGRRWKRVTGSASSTPPIARAGSPSSPQTSRERWCGCILLDPRRA